MVRNLVEVVNLNIDKSFGTVTPSMYLVLPAVALNARTSSFIECIIHTHSQEQPLLSFHNEKLTWSIRTKDDPPKRLSVKLHQWLFLSSPTSPYARIMGRQGSIWNSWSFRPGADVGMCQFYHMHAHHVYYWLQLDRRKTGRLVMVN